MNPCITAGMQAQASLNAMRAQCVNAQEIEFIDIIAGLVEAVAVRDLVIEELRAENDALRHAVCLLDFPTEGGLTLQ